MNFKVWLNLFSRWLCLGLKPDDLPKEGRYAGGDSRPRDAGVFRILTTFVLMETLLCFEAPLHFLSVLAS